MCYLPGLFHPPPHGVFTAVLNPAAAVLPSHSTSCKLSTLPMHIRYPDTKPLILDYFLSLFCRLEAPLTLQADLGNLQVVNILPRGARDSGAHIFCPNQQQQRVPGPGQVRPALQQVECLLPSRLPELLLTGGLGLPPPAPQGSCCFT